MPIAIDNIDCVTYIIYDSARSQASSGPICNNYKAEIIDINFMYGIVGSM